jgi:hypothetical protein
LLQELREVLGGEGGRLIRLDGPSIRTLHLKLDEALKDDSVQDDEVARISGNKRPEFLEPTNVAKIAHACSPVARPSREG